MEKIALTNKQPPKNLQKFTILTLLFICCQASVYVFRSQFKKNMSYRIVNSTSLIDLRIASSVLLSACHRFFFSTLWSLRLASAFALLRNRLVYVTSCLRKKWPGKDGGVDRVSSSDVQSSLFEPRSISTNATYLPRWD